MRDSRPRLLFDYVDPGSYVMELRVARVARRLGCSVERVPFEVRPPPDPMLDADDPAWRSYWEAMAVELERERLRPRRPTLVPWTRKAHELGFHAREQKRFEALHGALFARCQIDGRDIGRVDELLAVAVEAGLDAGVTKAVLDVDRHAEAVRTARRQASEAGVRGVPTLWSGSELLEGVHDEDAIHEFLLEDRRTRT